VLALEEISRVFLHPDHSAGISDDSMPYRIKSHVLGERSSVGILIRKNRIIVAIRSSEPENQILELFDLLHEIRNR